MKRDTVVRAVCGGVLFLLALGACKAASGPNPGTPTGPGVAVAPTKPVLFEDEKPMGKIVAFKDAEEMKSFNDAWYEDTHGGKPAFFKMPGDGDAGAPPAKPGTTPTVSPPKPKAPSPSFAPPPSGAAGPAPQPASPPPPPARARPADGKAAAAESAKKDSSSRSESSASADKKGAASGADESITNNQHAEVDEGDIVKLHGEHLVVLRRGRLFTITLGDRPKQSKMVDAFGPDIEPRGSWYDEMVVDGDNVVVVGFSYARGGTEIGLFKIDKEGGLTYRATYHLKSNDYYSARNYASRIVDGRLIFYAPLSISPQANGGDLTVAFPAVRKWRRAGTNEAFTKTLVPTKLFHMDGEFPATPTAALHTVTSCDLRDPNFPCESVALVGPPGRVFYVSPTSVYVWMQDHASSRRSEGPQRNGLVARLPIGRTTSPPSALRVSGMPTDQFSFDEDAGHLNVFVRAQSNGDAMFASDNTAGAAALMRVPLNMFGDEVLNVSSKRYRVLPRPDGHSVQNRYVAGWLLYGSGQGFRTSHAGGKGQLFAVKVASPDDPPTSLELDQGVDRIEPMADDAVIVGSRGSDLVFTPLELGTSKEAHARRDYVRKNASQGELRSHGFFYKPGKGPREGMIGLPIRNDFGGGQSFMNEGSASVLFLQARSLEFTELGSLRASRVTSNSDGCRASCADWYGNARPIFAKGRIFALMGYDLVEGAVEDGRNTRGQAQIVERSRINFAPRGGPPVDDLDDLN